MERDNIYEVFNATSATLGLLAIAFASFPKYLRRKWFMKEFNATCQHCGKKWDDDWMLEYHHIIPTEHGGKDTLENATLLCQSCHAAAHKRLNQPQATDAIRGRIRKTGGRNKYYGK